jgi:membrane fusion protein, multidrug efflux system
LVKRHFFLVAAIVVLVVMAVAGGLKLTVFGRDGGGEGVAQAGPRPGGAGAPGAGGQGGQGGQRPGGPGGGGFGGGAQVTPAVVTMRTFTEGMELLGVAKGRQSVTLSSSATELVQRVRFRDGQHVRQGQVLVELQATEQNADVAQARARLVQAERDWQRWQQLGEKGYASKASLDQYRAALDSARASVDAAQARLGDRVIRAPFSGVVGLTDLTAGAIINPGSPIATLDDMSSMRVDFKAPDRYLSLLREGQPIVAKPDALPTEVFNGRVARIDTRVDQATRSVTARAEFPNRGGRMKPGMLMRVQVAEGQRQAAAAPEAAVSVQGDQAFVYVIAQREGRTIAEQRTVLTGIRQDGFVEIRNGLRAGERIVADGLNRIQPNQPLRIVGPDGPGGRPGGRPAGGFGGQRPGGGAPGQRPAV